MRRRVKAHSGLFKPNNPKKYHGDVKNIVYRSSWELKLMRLLDANPNVLAWGSEEKVIPYISPVDKKRHRYFVDFICALKVGDTVETLLIEVKPNKETKRPVLKEGAKITKRYKEECITFAINQAKWQAAEEYCAERGWKFRIFDEFALGIKR